MIQSLKLENPVENSYELPKTITVYGLHLVSLNSEIVETESFCSVTKQFIHNGYIDGYWEEKSKQSMAFLKACFELLDKL